jgi:hypothetical protein
MLVRGPRPVPLLAAHSFFKFHLRIYTFLFGTGFFFVEKLSQSRIMSLLLRAPKQFARWLLVVLLLLASCTIDGVYTPVPKDYRLQSVVMIVRHGDRSQITRDLGYAFVEGNNLTAFWRSKLPTEQTLRTLVMHQRLSKVFTLEELRKKLYAGWDFAMLPYGQLTELGTQQLMQVGKNLRQRYHELFPPPAAAANSSEYVFCRSTNLCRTILSTRSLLAGLLFESEEPPNLSLSSLKGVLSGQQSTSVKVRLPLIYSKLKTEETMYPHADGPCWAMSERRRALIKDLMYPNPLKATVLVPSYVTKLEARLRASLGLKGLNWMTWLNLMEIMVCFQAHNLTLPEGISEEDVTNTVEFVTWKWGVLYQVSTILYANHELKW